MKARIVVRIVYPDYATAPALYWSARKAIGVPEDVSDFNAGWPTSLVGDVDPDKWTADFDTVTDQITLEYGKPLLTLGDIGHWAGYPVRHPGYPPSYEFAKNLDFQTAYDIARAQWRVQRHHWALERLQSKLMTGGLLRRLVGLLGKGGADGR